MADTHTLDELSDEDLVSYVAERHPASAQNAGLAEMQRRAIRATRELTTAVQASGDCAVEQNAQMLKLTISIRTLTGVAIVLVAVQIIIAIFT